MMTHSNTAQLGLPFDSSVLRTWTDNAGTSLELSVSLTATGATLELRGPWPSEEPAACLPQLPPPSGVLWRATVDMLAPRRTRIAPSPVQPLRPISFPTHLPVDCFTAPLAWAAEVGLRQGLAVEGLLMAMRRSLVMVARHLERVHLSCPPAGQQLALAV